MDKARLSVAVYKKTGIALDPTDPAFAIAELCSEVVEGLLEKTLDQIDQQLKALPERIRSSGTAVVSEAACQAVERVVEMLREARRTIASESEEVRRQIVEQAGKTAEVLGRQVAAAERSARAIAEASAVRARWVLVGAVIGVLACAGGFVAGQLTEAVRPFQHSTGR